MPDGRRQPSWNTETLHTWHITHTPQPTSPYAPGTYGLILTLPTDYPFKPPVLKFTTRIYHPNVTNDQLGNICLGTLKAENWKPSTKIAAVLEAIRSLLEEPQPDDPLEDRIAEEYRNNREEFNKNCKQYVERYAMKEPEFPRQP